MEGEERDSNRQRNERRCGEVFRFKEIGRITDQLPNESSVFVITESSDVDDYADPQQRFAANQAGSCNMYGQKLIEDDGKQQQKNRAAGADQIEDQTSGENDRVLPSIAAQIIE